MKEEYLPETKHRDLAAGESERITVISASRVFGDEPRASPLTGYGVMSFAHNLGGTAELSVPVLGGVAFSFFSGWKPTPLVLRYSL